MLQEVEGKLLLNVKQMYDQCTEQFRDQCTEPCEGLACDVPSFFFHAEQNLFPLGRTEQKSCTDYGCSALALLALAG